MATKIKRPRWLPKWIFNIVVDLVNQLLQALLERVGNIEERVSKLERGDYP